MKTNSKKIISSLLALLPLFICIQLKAQCTGEIITLANPSFEGSPSTGAAPTGWEACQSGQSPDIQPGSFNINLIPSNGLSYAGFYFLDTLFHPNIGTWQEGLSQELNTHLVKGMEYHSSVDLSNSTTTNLGLEPGCAELEIWGGFSACDHSELLWSSGDIINYDTWKKYSVIFNPTSDYTFISIQIKGLGCSGMPYILVDNFSDLIPQYTISLNLAADKDSVCAGTSVNLNAEALNGFGSYVYNWNNILTNTSQQVINPSGTSTISVTATDSNGCVSVPSTITVYTFSQLSLVYSIQPVCEGSLAQLELFGKGGNGNYQFKLSPLNLFGNLISFVPQNDMLYTVELSDGCSSITDTIHIVINPNPVADFSVSKQAPLTFSFSDLSTVSVGSVSHWAWSFGDLHSSTDMNPTHDYTQNGNYTVLLQTTSTAGCKSLTKALTIQINSIPVSGENLGVATVDLNPMDTNAVSDENPEGSSVDLSPSVTGVGVEAIKINTTEMSTIELYTMTGVKVVEINNTENTIFSSIQKQSLTNGIYVYRLINSGKVVKSGQISIVKN